MTNWEKYKDFIISLAMHQLAVDKETGEPFDCTNGDKGCDKCLFPPLLCEDIAPRDWLNAEYIEPPKDNIELATLIAYLRQEPNQMKQIKTIKIVDGMPVINGGD